MGLLKNLVLLAPLLGTSLAQEQPLSSSSLRTTTHTVFSTSTAHQLSTSTHSRSESSSSSKALAAVPLATSSSSSSLIIPSTSSMVMLPPSTSSSSALAAATSNAATLFLMASTTAMMDSSSSAMPDAAATSAAADDDDDEPPPNYYLPMCNISADSPGNLFASQLDMTNVTIATAFLGAIMDDNCLQNWANSRAISFWIGIAVVIGVFAVGKGASRLANFVAIKQAAKNKYSTHLVGPVDDIVSIVRGFANMQYTPTGIPHLLQIPPFGVVIMIALYFGYLLLLTFVNSSTGDDQTLQNMSVKAGWLAVAQLPLVVLLSNKRNFIGLVTQVGYERLNVLHRWTARGLFMSATLHFMLQAIGWRRAGVFEIEWTTDSCIPTGLAVYVILGWMNLSTIAPIRNLSYEIFVIQHIVTWFGFVVALFYHLPSTAYYSRVYAYIAIGFYLVARLVQAVISTYRNIRPGTAEITQISENCVRLEVEPRNFKSWSAGSHVLMSIPRLGLASHPFTIASTPRSANGKLIFFLRRHAGFTKRVFNSAVKGHTHKVLVDGPYGAKHNDLAAYNTVVLIAGATGISFTLPLFIDLAERAARQKLPVREVHFIWAVKDRDCINWLEGQFDHAVETLVASGIKVTVNVHVTCHCDGDADLDVDRKGHHLARVEDVTAPYASEKDVDVDFEKSNVVSIQRELRSQSSNSNSSGSLKHVESGTGNGEAQRTSKICVCLGRPRIRTMLDLISANSGSGSLGLATCGPLGMATSVRNTVSNIQMKTFRRDGGMYLHVEGFGW